MWSCPFKINVRNKQCTSISLGITRYADSNNVLQVWVFFSPINSLYRWKYVYQFYLELSLNQIKHTIFHTNIYWKMNFDHMSYKFNSYCEPQNELWWCRALCINYGFYFKIRPVFSWIACNLHAIILTIHLLIHSNVLVGGLE